jgi:integrase
MLAKKHAASDLVFHKMDGGRWGAIHESFNVLVRRCGLKSEPPFNITLHTLRQTFGSWLAAEGFPLRAIQKLMGHRSITTTERYARPSGEILGAAIERIERLLPKSLPSVADSDGNGQSHALVTVRK